MQEALNKSYDNYIYGGGNNILLASSLKIRTTQSINNALVLDKQIASDLLLTNLMKELKFDGFILWKEGKRRYYISTKI